MANFFINPDGKLIAHYRFGRYENIVVIDGTQEQPLYRDAYQLNMDEHHDGDGEVLINYADWPFKLDSSYDYGHGPIMDRYPGFRVGFLNGDILAKIDHKAKS